MSLCAPPRVCLGLLASLALLAADADAATDPPSCPAGATGHAAVVCELNAARAAAGRGPVAHRPSLSRAATAHARDMVERRYFAHESPEGDGPAIRARRAGYTRGARSWRIGEILLWTRGAPLTARAAVQMWLGSASHRRILLAARYDDVGVGLVPGAPRPGAGEATTLAVLFGRRAYARERAGADRTEAGGRTATGR